LEEITMTNPSSAAGLPLAAMVAANTTDTEQEHGGEPIVGAADADAHRSTAETD
jgi:hypothetical protein